MERRDNMHEIKHVSAATTTQRYSHECLGAGVQLCKSVWILMEANFGKTKEINNMCIYIYIYIERERETGRFTYIYIYVCVLHVHCSPRCLLIVIDACTMLFVVHLVLACKFIAHLVACL